MRVRSPPGVSLPFSPSKRDQLGAMRVEFRRAAFVDGDVRVAWQKIAPCGGQSVAVASALAAVPVITGKTATSRSNTFAMRRRELFR